MGALDRQFEDRNSEKTEVATENIDIDVQIATISEQFSQKLDPKEAMIAYNQLEASQNQLKPVEASVIDTVRFTSDLAKMHHLTYRILKSQGIPTEIPLSPKFQKLLFRCISKEDWAILFGFEGYMVEYDMDGLETVKITKPNMNKNTNEESKISYQTRSGKFSKFEELGIKMLEGWIADAKVRDLRLSFDGISSDDALKKGISIKFQSSLRGSTDECTVQTDLERMPFTGCYESILKLFQVQIDTDLIAENEAQNAYLNLSIGNLKIDSGRMKKIYDAEKLFNKLKESLCVGEITIQFGYEEMQDRESRARKLFDLHFARNGMDFDKFPSGEFVVKMDNADNSILLIYDPYLSSKKEKYLKEVKLSMSNLDQIADIEGLLSGLELVATLVNKDSTHNSERMKRARHVAIVGSTISELIKEYHTDKQLEDAKVNSNPNIPSIVHTPLYKLCKLAMEQAYPAEEVHKNLLIESSMYKNLVDEISIVLKRLNFKEDLFLFDYIYPVMIETLRGKPDVAINRITSIEDDKLKTIAWSVFNSIAFSANECLAHLNKHNLTNAASKVVELLDVYFRSPSRDLQSGFSIYASSEIKKIDTYALKAVWEYFSWYNTYLNDDRESIRNQPVIQTGVVTIAEQIETVSTDLTDSNTRSSTALQATIAYARRRKATQ
jgi:hypothetical protein